MKEIEFLVVLLITACSISGDNYKSGQQEQLKEVYPPTPNSKWDNDYHYVDSLTTEIEKRVIAP